MNLKALALAIIFFQFAACATTPEAAPVLASADDKPSLSDFLDRKAHSIDGRLFIGPQPQANDLHNLKTEGIERVISFRRPSEVAKLDFREGERLAELGIDYVEIPVGGKNYPYSPAQLIALTKALEDDGKVLMHCGSGYRASVIAVAYLIEVQGMPINEAVRHAEGWWPLELASVLGDELSLSSERH